MAVRVQRDTENQCEMQGKKHKGVREQGKVGVRKGNVSSLLQRTKSRCCCVYWLGAKVERNGWKSGLRVSEQKRRGETGQRQRVREIK